MLIGLSRDTFQMAKAYRVISGLTCYYQGNSDSSAIETEKRLED